MAGNPKVVWMVGDSMEADIKGAEAMGINSVLVRSSKEPGATAYANYLLEAAQIIHHWA